MIDRLLRTLRRRERPGWSLVRLTRRLRNPTSVPEAEQLDLARRLSRRFHGFVDIVELQPEERVVSRYLVVLGEIPALEYLPDPQSKRGGVIWRHEAGDIGFGRNIAGERPLLCVDPVTRRPVIVPNRSRMTFDPDHGLVG